MKINLMDFSKDKRIEVLTASTMVMVKVLKGAKVVNLARVVDMDILEVGMILQEIVNKEVHIISIQNIYICTLKLIYI